VKAQRLRSSGVHVPYFLLSLDASLPFTYLFPYTFQASLKKCHWLALLLSALDLVVDVGLADKAQAALLCESELG
jgi:hypothetical protein